jgi:hypothetical protein
MKYLAKIMNDITWFCSVPKITWNLFQLYI